MAAEGPGLRGGVLYTFNPFLFSQRHKVSVGGTVSRCPLFPLPVRPSAPEGGVAFAHAERTLMALLL